MKGNELKMRNKKYGYLMLQMNLLVIRNGYLFT